MKVLIVEDDAAKLQKVAKSVREAVEEPIVIETAHDIGQAKRALLATQYDVAILDLSLPMMAGEGSAPFAGRDLVEELARRSRYHRPSHIIGLTAYSDLMNSSSQVFHTNLWSLIYYDATSEEWAEQISRKIKYVGVSLRAGHISEYQSDVCVLTALHSPELEALLRLNWNWQALQRDGDATAYYEGSLLKGERRLRVIAASATQMGMTASAVLATKMIHTFHPKVIAMIGICAGVRGTSNYGDVLCVDPCWDWGSGKFVEKDGRTDFLQAPSQARLDNFLKSNATELSRDQGVWDQIKREWQAGVVPQESLRMQIGPLASGGSVLSDMTTSATVREQHRNLRGIDMEAYSVFAAAAESVLPQPKAIAFKSVVDYADPEKDDRFQAYAAYTSARALEAFVLRYL